MSASNDEAELDLYLDHGLDDTFVAHLRVTRPGVETEERLEVAGLSLDRVALREHELDPAAYGRVLKDFLFSPTELRDAFTAARNAASRLRIRLSIATSVPELEDVRWESLADPNQPDVPLLHDPRILFSRYLSSFDWRPVRLRPRQRLRAVVVVANPSDLADYDLSPIDVTLEVENARTVLKDADGGEIPCSVVCGAPEVPPGRAMFERMIEALQEECDILYVVCHGSIDRNGRSSLWLEDAEGRVAKVPGALLAQKLLEVEERPRLVVLASCQGAGSSSAMASSKGRALMALGPQLAKAGIPAVVAMNGDVAMSTVAEFMPAFFRALAEDGLVDHAMAMGRAAIARRDEACRPVLFMRLRRGRIWYDAGFAGQSTIRSWAGLCKRIKQGRCTPLLGFGVLEALFEYRSWTARRWAKQHGFPLAPSQREDLAHVAQFLANSNYATFPHEQLSDDLAKGLCERLGVDAANGDVDELLMALLMRRSSTRASPHRILAELPLPVYLSFCPDSLLFDTLARTQIALGPGAEPVTRRPRQGVLRWKPQLKHSDLPNPWSDGEDYVPTVEEPLVYHLFGIFDVPESLVLTQDDYFDFLLNFQNPEVHHDIPGVVRKQLVNTSLLFLGFPLDSWEFRAVFRTILQQGATADLGQGQTVRVGVIEGLSSATKPHVAAQVEPEEGRVLDPVAAHDFMHDAFKQAQVDVYFGTVERFLVDLELQAKKVSV